MKGREMATILSGVVALLLFAMWMFHHQSEVDRINLIRQDIVNDSIIMSDHANMMKADSALNKKLKNHEYRIKKLENK
jgi:hypothetical protein